MFGRISLILLLSLSTLVPAKAAIDMFLKLDTVPGESVDKSHSTEIDVLAWSWGMSNPATIVAGGGIGSGKVNIQELSLTKYLDKASPLMMLGCSQGKHYASAVLTLRKAGAVAVEFMKITLTDVLVTSLSTGGSGGEDRLTENVTLAFAKVKVEYWPQKADGTLIQPAITYTWDLEANTP
jgi:type VI secretion system secreted protein Hcp